jgi:alkylated DNA repair protein alkB family protein 7
VLRKRKYQRAHFDGVIEGYREIERPLSWFSALNRETLERIGSLVFGPSAPPLLPPHVLELAPGREGYIRPHVDNVEASGRTIAGISLLADAVMRLTHASEPERTVCLLLPSRSLYVLHDEARYEWRHEILPDLDMFPSHLRACATPPAGGGSEAEPCAKLRRVAVVMRDESRTAMRPQALSPA